MGYSAAIQTDLGGKKYDELVSVVCLNLLFPKLGFPEEPSSSLKNQPLSLQEKQEMLTHQNGTWANFCPADLRISGTRMQVEIAAAGTVQHIRSWSCSTASWYSRKRKQNIR